MKTIVTKDIFVRIRFSNFEYQNFTIGLLVVSSFANDSIVFFQKSKFHLIFLIHYSKFIDVKDCVKQKKRNSSYKQCLLSATDELSQI